MKNTLKQLNYQFPYLLNPYAKEMEEEIDRWITSFKSLDEAHRIRIIFRLRQLACYCVIMVNDFFFAHKEQIGGDVFNQVLIIQHERGCTLDEAREELLEMHENYKNEFLSLRFNLPPFGIYQQQVTSYLRELEAQVIGHLNWYLFDTGRYKYNIL